MNPVFAQAVSIVAMAFLVLSFQMKTPKGILLMQSVGAFLISVSFFFLEKYVGAMLNVLAFVRAILLFNKEKLHTDSNLWLMIFGVGYIGAYILTFFLLPDFHQDIRQGPRIKEYSGFQFGEDWR